MAINDFSTHNIYIPERTVTVPVGRHRVYPETGGLRDVSVTGVHQLVLATAKLVTGLHKVLYRSLFLCLFLITRWLGKLFLDNNWQQLALDGGDVPIADDVVTDPLPHDVQVTIEQVGVDSEGPDTPHHLGPHPHLVLLDIGLGGDQAQVGVPAQTYEVPLSLVFALLVSRNCHCLHINRVPVNYYTLVMVT